METQSTATPTASAVIASTEAAVETAATPVEAAVEAKPEQTPEDESFARKFSALSKRERELQKRDEELKIKSSGYSSVEEYKKLAKTNINKWLEETGVSFDDITEYYLSGGTTQDPKLTEVEEKLKNLEKSLMDKENQAQELDRQNAVKSYKADQKAFIQSKAAEYELIASTDNFELVYDVTKQYYDKHNKVLTHDEAAKMVEDHLEKEVEKVLKASKIRNKFAAQADIKTENGTKTETAKETIKTLNNSMTGATNTPSSKPLTREQSLERVASMLKFS